MRLAGTKLAANHQYRGFGDQLYDLSGERPSLDLNFANTKSLVDATTGQNLVTFTRASSGTYVDSQGVISTATTNEARFDHNPTTGESLGLLVEEQRTNLMLRSEEFGATPTWSPTDASITSDSVIAPTGLLTADTYTEAATGTPGIFQTVSGLNASTVYTGSLYIKKGNNDWYRLLFVDNSTFANGARAWVNLTTGVLGTVENIGTGTGVSSSITPLANGWYRVSLSTAIGGSNTVFRFQVSSASGNGSSTRSFGSIAYLWGAQLEAGAFPTSYIPTTTATATRSADVASITGSNFSSWYRQDEGTVFANTSGLAIAPVTSLQTQYAIHDGSTDNRITVYKRANADTSTRLDITAATSSSAFINAGTFGLNNLTASAIRANDFAASLNGLSAVVDTSGNVPSVNQINIGSYVGATGFINGTIRRLTYFPTRLANETLQRITQ